MTWRLYGSLPRTAIERIESSRRLLEREAANGQETASQRKIRQGKKLFAVIDELLDNAVGGPTWLKQESIASIVEQALLTRYAYLYSLWAYVIMPNHVHVLLRPKVARALDRDLDASELQAEACATSQVSLSEIDVSQTQTLQAEAQTLQAEACATSQVSLSEITRRLKGYSAREANKLLNRTGQPFWQAESFDHWSRSESEFQRIVRYIEDNPVKAGLCSAPDDWRWSSAWIRSVRGMRELEPLT